MRIAVLSRAPKTYSTRRLVEAIERRGHEAEVLDVLELSISLERSYPEIYLRSEPLPEFDAAIPRIGTSVTFYGTAVLRQLEKMDIFCANSAQGVTNSRDKLRCLQILSRHDIGIPATEFVRRRQDVLPAIERVGGPPVIIKLLDGTQGVGVILAEKLEIASAIIETLQSTKQNVLVQKFVAEAKGTDIRALVVGDRIVAAMRRRAQGQEFRSNVHQGGSGEPIQLDPAYEETAIRAVRLVGLRIAGVDMLEGRDGPQVLEINSSPGLQGIETTTGIDVAGAIIDYLGEHVRFPDLDLRQRLTVSRGSGVAEISISERSSLLGQTIAESGLQEKELVILTLHRGGKVVTNPRAHRRLRAGDRLLCFGKLDVMKDFLPERKRPRVRRLNQAKSSAGSLDKSPLPGED